MALGAVVPGAGADRIFLAVVGADTHTGDNIDDLTVTGVCMQADG